MLNGYIGTYNDINSKGIYQFTFDEITGLFNGISSFYLVDDAKCVTSYKNRLIITMSENNHGGIALLDIEKKIILDKILYEDKTPCFVKYDNGFVYTANYHDGVVMIYKIYNDKLELLKKIDIMPKAGCHQVLIHQDYLLVPCLLIDEIRIFDINNDFKYVQSIKFSQSTGPRHGVFNKKHSLFYLISELSSELFIFSVSDNLNFKLINKIALLPKDKLKNTSSAGIYLSKNEQYLYISTRGINLLTVIKLDNEPTIIQQINSGGIHPRDFLLTIDEKYLLAVNRDTNNLVSFAIDNNTGKIIKIIDKITVPKGVGISL